VTCSRGPRAPRERLTASQPEGKIAPNTRKGKDPQGSWKMGEINNGTAPEAPVKRKKGEKKG